MRGNLVWHIESKIRDSDLEWRNGGLTVEKLKLKKDANKQRAYLQKDICF